MQEGLASKTPFFQEFHCVLRQQALGLLMRPMNGLAVVQGLRRPGGGRAGVPGGGGEALQVEAEENMMAAERAGVCVGSILVAVNGGSTSHAQGFEAAIGKVKAAGRPVTLGFRMLHPVVDPGFGPRRLWQGYLFARFSLGRTWTGRFYVLREDGSLRGFPGKEYADHVEELRVAAGSAVRCVEPDITEAARAMGDLGEDGRGSLGPRVLAVPVHADSEDDVAAAKWAFFRAENDDSKDDWLMALTTLTILHQQAREERKRAKQLALEQIERHAAAGPGPPSPPPDPAPRYAASLAALPFATTTTSAVPGRDSPLSSSTTPTATSGLSQPPFAAAATTGFADGETRRHPASFEAGGVTTTEVVRQGYMWMKVSTTARKKKENTLSADLASRLEPWRRRWFVLRADALRWYVSPPTDASEVPSGALRLDRAIVAVARVEHDQSVYHEPSTKKESPESRPFELTVTEAAKKKNADDDRLNLALRCPSHEDGADWVRLLRFAAGSADLSSQRPDSRKKDRLAAMVRDPAVALDAPEAAYGLLVPVDRSDEVDRDAWLDGAGYHLGPLCDPYVADAVFDALVRGVSDASIYSDARSTSAKTPSRGSRPGSQDLSERPPTSTTPFGAGGNAATSGENNKGGDITPARPEKNRSSLYDGGDRQRGGSERERSAADWRDTLVAKASATARKLGADASQRVSELLYDKEAAARRAEADVKTSRRRAEALTSRDLRLSCEVFARYCAAFRTTVRQHKESWDELRHKLGLEGLELLVQREDLVADGFGDEGVLYATDRRLYLAHKGGVTVLSIDAVARVDLSRGGQKTSNDADATSIRLELAPGRRYVHVVPLKQAQGPAAATDACLGDYPGGGRPFAGSLLKPALDHKDDDDALFAAAAHGGDADLSDADDDLDDEQAAMRACDAYVLHLAPGSQPKKPTPSHTLAASGASANPVDDDDQDGTHDLVGLASTDERARRWLEALRELVEAASLAARLTACANWRSAAPSRLAGVLLVDYYWRDVRIDARHASSQGPFFEADRRRVQLWSALNLVRRRALRRCCGVAPPELLVCSRPTAALDRFLSRETVLGLSAPDRVPASSSGANNNNPEKIGERTDDDDGRTVDRAWLKAAVAYAARVEDLERRRRLDIETFSPARFRDEWTVFWQHVDPIWDGLFETVAQIRAWDRPGLSALVFGGLLALALADRLDVLPALACALYAAAVLENGRRAKRRRAKRRRRRDKKRQSQQLSAVSGEKPTAGPPSVETASRRLTRLFSRSQKPLSLADPGGSLTSLKDDDSTKDDHPRRPSLDEDAVSNAQRTTDTKSRTDPATSAAEAVFGVFGQLRELRAGLGKAQSVFHDYNTSLLRCRALHRWTDPGRTACFVAALLTAALVFAIFPLNWVVAGVVLYFGTDPLFENRGLSRAVSDEYFDGLPTASRTHGNVHFAAIARRDPIDAAVFPPVPAFFPGLGLTKSLYSALDRPPALVTADLGAPRRSTSGCIAATDDDAIPASSSLSFSSSDATPPSRGGAPRLRRGSDTDVSTSSTVPDSALRRRRPSTRF